MNLVFMVFFIVRGKPRQGDPPVACSPPPLLPLLLSGRNPQLIRILFPIHLSGCHAGPLAISLIDISGVFALMCAVTHSCVWM